MNTFLIQKSFIRMKSKILYVKVLELQQMTDKNLKLFYFRNSISVPLTAVKLLCIFIFVHEYLKKRE